MISGLVTMSGREHPAIQPVASELRDRIIALGQAHDFVRPHSEASRPAQEQSSLHGLLEQLLAPYQSADGTRIRIDGSDATIDDRSATPLALLFHELATNAAKYGALSATEGGVSLTTSIIGDHSRIEWREHGGPPVIEAVNSGFGSRLIAMSVERQLGGSIERRWEHDGLQVSVTLPLIAMQRG